MWSPLCLFLITTDLVAWSNTTLLLHSSAGQKSKWAQIKVMAELHSFWRLCVKMFPCLFQLLEAACIPWFLAPSSIFKANSVGSSSLYLWALLLSPDLLPWLWPSCLLFPMLGLLWSHRTHQVNPGKSPHLKVCTLNYICKVPFAM